MSYYKQWYKINKKRLNEKSRKYYLEHKEKMLVYNKIYRKTHKRINSEKEKNYKSLWNHKNREILTEKYRDFQHKNYIFYQGKTLSNINGCKWSQHEISFLKENYYKKTILEMAQVLGRTWGGTSKKLNRLKLFKVKKRLKFLLEDLKNANNKTTRQ